MANEKTSSRKYSKLDRIKVQEAMPIALVMNKYIEKLQKERGEDDYLVSKMYREFWNMRYDRRYISPLHDGDGKNFVIYNDTQQGTRVSDGLFHGKDCFKCWSRPDETGDVITFYMMLNKCKFTKAMDDLFVLCGFKTESEKTPEEIESEKKAIEELAKRNEVYAETKEIYDFYYEKLNDVRQYLYDMMQKNKPKKGPYGIIEGPNAAWDAVHTIYSEVSWYCDSFPREYISLLPKRYRNDIRKHQENKFQEDDLIDDKWADTYFTEAKMETKFKEWLKVFKDTYEKEKSIYTI